MEVSIWQIVQVNIATGRLTDSFGAVEIVRVSDCSSNSFARRVLHMLTG